jgi:hypothetical protein
MPVITPGRADGNRDRICRVGALNSHKTDPCPGCLQQEISSDYDFIVGSEFWSPDGCQWRSVLSRRRTRIWPGDFQRGFLADEKFRTAANANVKGVRIIGDNVSEAFLLNVQALVGAVQSDTQGMDARGKGAVETERFAQTGGVQPSGDEDILAGIDRDGFLRNGGDDLHAKRSVLLGKRRLSAGGWGGGGRLSNRRVICQRRGESGSLPPSRG